MLPSDNPQPSANGAALTNLGQIKIIRCKFCILGRHEFKDLIKNSSLGVRDDGLEVGKAQRGGKRGVGRCCDPREFSANRRLIEVWLNSLANGDLSTASLRVYHGQRAFYPYF